MRVFLAALLMLAGAAPVLAHGGGSLDGAVGLSMLTLGFAIGLVHALDADHVAAVATMMGRGDNRRQIVARGLAWGVGHTISLFVICSVVLLLGLTISATVEAALELVVGLLILLLGLRVLWKLRRDRVHIHVHEHDGSRHIHAHSHATETGDHARSEHDHRHGNRALIPTLGVGLVHGAAGSAGLLVLIVASATSLSEALAAFALFGVGSMIGMGLLTAAASYPLGYINRGAAWMQVSLGLTIGILATIVGAGVISASLGGLGIGFL